MGAPGSISTARETSLYVSPNRSNGASMVPSSRTEGLANNFLTIDSVFLNTPDAWKLAGKYTSRLFQDAQEGKSLGIRDGFG